MGTSRINAMTHTDYVHMVSVMIVYEVITSGSGWTKCEVLEHIKYHTPIFQRI